MSLVFEEAPKLILFIVIAVKSPAVNRDLIAYELLNLDITGRDGPPSSGWKSPSSEETRLFNYLITSEH